MAQREFDQLMKTKLSRLSDQYLTALRKHLQTGLRKSLQPALRLGGRLVALGSGTLELARIHERAILVLKPVGSTKTFHKRAEIFFTEALTPILQTHRATRQDKVELKRLNLTLDRRTVELATTHRQLQLGVARHKVMQATLEKNGKHHDRCLEESLELQKRLRQLTHRVLAVQEDERHKLSHELQDEVAQTLLGINVRLLNLKQEARSSTKGIKNQIASTQQLVVESAKSVRRFARELDLQQPT